MSDEPAIYFRARSDKEVLSMLGEFIRKSRLEQNKTQQQLADEAGLNRSTIIVLEKGEGGTLSTFLQVLRVLDKLSLMGYFEYKRPISPLLLAEAEHNERKRARKKPVKNYPKKSDW